MRPSKRSKTGRVLPCHGKKQRNKTFRGGGTLLTPTLRVRYWVEGKVKLGKVSTILEGPSGKAYARAKYVTVRSLISSEGNRVRVTSREGPLLTGRLQF